MSTRTVFVTGATGYIGGQVVYNLLNSKNFHYEITALVRTQAKGDKLSSATNGRVKTVVGCLDDRHVIEQYVSQSDVIVNTANVDHVPSAEVLAEVLSKTQKPTILVHTSGTSILGDPLEKGKKASTKIYSDIASIDEINSLDENQPHRPVDKIIQGISSCNPKVKTAIVCPSAIFGRSNGFDNIISIQVPFLAKLSVKRGRAFTVYDGNYIWSHVHIADLGDLYQLLVEKFLNGESIPEGREGYYFGSLFTHNEGPATEKPTEIEHFWADVSSAVAEKLAAKKLIKSADVDHLDAEEVAGIYDKEPFAPFYWGTNSRSRADNGAKIGWKPTHTSEKEFWDSIGEDIDYLQENNLWL